MKSQVSMEFLTGVAVMLFIYAVVLGVFSSYIHEPMVKNELGRQVCYSVARTIDSVSSGGAGFSARNSLPQTISGDYYEVLVSNDSLVSVYWADKVTACAISTQNITMTVFNSCTFAAKNTGTEIIVSAVSTEKIVYKLDEEIAIQGGYFPSDVLLQITNSEDDLILNETIVPIDGFFVYNWNASAKDTHVIYAEDKEQKSLNSNTEVIII